MQSRCVRRGGKALALLALALAALGRSPASAEMTISIIAPWSARVPYAALGTMHGAELMLQRLNVTGGLLGQRLGTAQVDDGCNPAQSEAAARAVIASRPVLAVGGACARGAVKISRLLAEAGILQVVPNVPQEEVSDVGIATLFRMAPRSDHEGAYTAELIARRWAGRRIALADDGEPLWHEAVTALSEGLARHGVPVTLTTRFSANAPSYADFVQELTDRGIELLYLDGLPPDIGLIVREAAKVGARMQIVVSRGGSVELFRQTAGAGLEGVVFTDHRDWVADALTDPVLAADRAQGGDISIFAVSAYAAVKIWAEAVQSTGSFEARTVAAAIKSGRFSTPFGPITFEPNGDLSPESEAWTAYRWHDGKAEPFE